MQTIFDVVPGWHQFGFQFIHLIGLSGQLPAGVEAALVLQGLGPLVLYNFILHYPRYVLCCTRRHWVHSSETSKRDSAAHCCNRALEEDTKRRQKIRQMTGLKVLLIEARNFLCWLSQFSQGSDQWHLHLRLDLNFKLAFKLTDFMTAEKQKTT